MSRGRSGQLAALAASVLAAALLAACGGSDDSGSGGEPSSNGAAQAGGGSGGQGGPDGSAEGKTGEAEDGKLGGPPISGPDTANVATPLRVSGGGSDQFRVRGGDNSIQDFGEEADEEELQEAAEVVHGFFVARAEGDWTGACSLMSEGLLEQVAQLASKSSAKGCPEFLSDFTTELPAAVWRELTTVDAGSLRHEDEQGFLIYRGSDETIYSMPLNDEDGEWKVTGLSSSAIG